MKKTAIFTICFICLFVVMGSSGYSQESISSNNNSGGAAAKKIEITYPEKSTVLSGYFLPVSWYDPEVENSKLLYPENYEKSGKTYQVTILDKKQKVVLQDVISNQNYIVFTYDKIENLEQDLYFAKVEDLDAFVSPATPWRFFYQKPFGNTPYSSEIYNDVGEDVTGNSKKRRSSDCSYCVTDNWPGMLVLLLSATTSNKYINIYCNQITWYSQTLSPAYSGPLFIHISAGNFKATYYDSIVYTFQCTAVYPWQYTFVRFP